MNNLEVVRQKITDYDNIGRDIAFWRFHKYKIVFTNGCFDILHRGHIEYLAKASSFGDILIVGLNSDKSVKSIKGDSRPFQDETTRSLILASLQFVDKVILFDEDTPYELIKIVQPNVLVKGADYKPEQIVGYDIVKAIGGEIVTVELTKGHSTTGIINKMNQS